MSDPENPAVTAENAEPASSSSSEPAVASPPPAQPTPAAQPGRATQTGMVKRNLIEMAKETMAHIEKAEKDKTIVFRTNDRRSVQFMIASLLILLGLSISVIANPETKGICTLLALVADFLFGLAIFWYVLLRFGTIRTLEPRHALLCWQLMLGTGVLFSFYAMNVALTFFTLASTKASGM